MKRLAIVIIALSIFQTSYAQWEFAYFSLNGGLVHNVWGPKPEGITNRFLHTPDGSYQLYMETAENKNNYLGYAMGLHGGLNFHYDFKGDKAGIVIGAEYVTNIFPANYVTRNPDYTLTEKLKIHQVSIPVKLKMGNNIFKKQRYFFVGATYNYNLFLEQIQTVNWSDEKSVRQRSSIEFIENNMTYFAGFNYLMMRVQLDYTGGSYFDKEFVDANNIPLYAHQKDNYLMIKTSMVIPLNEWLFLNSWVAESIRRRLKGMF